MKLLILSLLAIGALSSCSRLATATLSNGKIVTINNTSAGDINYGDMVWIDTTKAPYVIVGFTHTDFGNKNAVPVIVINNN
jgi:hypothetical protein